MLYDNSDNEYQDLLKAIGSNLIKGWTVDNLVTVFNDKLVSKLQKSIIHKYFLYNDIVWYIVDHNPYKDIKKINKLSSKYLLIEVNGSIYDEGLDDDLQDILNIQAYGGSAGKQRVTKAYWEAIKEIKKDLENNPIE